jgi:hypothetical protein
MFFELLFIVGHMLLLTPDLILFLEVDLVHSRKTIINCRNRSLDVEEGFCLGLFDLLRVVKLFFHLDEVLLRHVICKLGVKINILVLRRKDFLDSLSKRLLKVLDAQVFHFYQALSTDLNDKVSSLGFRGLVDYKAAHGDQFEVVGVKEADHLAVFSLELKLVDEKV